ncbi:MAG TPA: DUF6616 family protein [Caldilineaceae bacterium]|nr:DUF6616 family protein [Caldilineaceae bacterium]
MATPIYKYFRLRWREAWYQLSQDEQQAILAKIEAAMNESGGKTVILCRSDWSNERWSGFGVEEFPNIEAVQQYAERLDGLGWFRYFDGETMLGTRFNE